MTTSLVDRLRRALSGTYRLDRELGGGGMSRVFVADEIALGRAVVLKVLPPEMAAEVSLERFRREIQLAASLQHPHIMQLLTAGEIPAEPGEAALLYYAMPFVEGQSLAERIAEHGALPISEVVRLLQDVADALAHAHGRGVVHRDVKPGNVMVAERHALVTDFGVAKALRVSSKDARVTTAGLVVGTPTYMAPEQASGDPTADHRADLYSLGAMAYEMLTGAPPFTAPSVQQVMVAHLTQIPAPIEARRPDIPAGLAAIVMQCLAKEPDLRPSSAAEIRRALEEVEVVSDVRTAAIPPATTRRRGAILAGIGIVAVLGLVFFTQGDALGTRSLVAEGALAPRQRVLVANFDNRTDDATLGVTVTEAFRVDFAQTKLLNVVSPEAIRAALRRMQRPDTTALSAAVAAELAIRDGIKAIVVGDVAKVGNRYALAVHLIEPRSGEELAAFRETADQLDGLIEAIDRLSGKLRRRTGESLQQLRANPPLAQVTTGSLEALRKFSVAAQALNAGRPDDALELLTEAVRLDSTFASAWRSIGVILNNSARDPVRTMAARERAYTLRNRLPARERYLAEASYLRSLGDAAGTAAAYRSLLELNPDDALALNNLGLVHADAGETEQAADLFRRALKSDTLQGIGYGNLIDVLLTRREIAAADSVHAVLIARMGSSARERLQRVLRHWVAGQPDSAMAAAERIAADPSTNPTYLALATEYAALIAGARSRLREAAKIYGRTATLGPMGQSRFVTSFATAATQQALGLGRPAAARSLLDRFLADTAWTSLGAADRPYTAVAMAYALAGAPDRAEALLREDEVKARGVGGGGKVVPLSRQDSAAVMAVHGLILVDRGQIAAGAAELDRADRLSARSWFADLAAAAYERLTMADSAVARYERFLASGYPYRLYVDAGRLGPALRRLGELYEARGDRGRAAQTYRQLLDLWREADSDFRPQIMEVRRRLAGLDAAR